MTDRLARDGQGVRHAAALLSAGRIVAIPTETVYGLAARFDDAAAVQAIFDAKQRPADDPLIVHVSPTLVGKDPIGGLLDRGLIAPLTEDQAHTARALVAAWWPGPLTLVLPRGPAVPDAITAGLPDVAIRMPRHRDALDVLDAAGHPLVAPSANRFGRISPTTADAVLEELDGRIDAVLDGGPCGVGVESTVLRVSRDGSTRRLRPGAIDDAMIAAVLGAAPRAPGQGESAASPGQALVHYAPDTPMVVGTAADVSPLLTRVAVLAWSDAEPLLTALRPTHHVVAHRVLAEDGTPETAARHLYQHLRALDGTDADVLLVEPVPEGGGLRDALRDRLRRAAARRS